MIQNIVTLSVDRLAPDSRVLDTSERKYPSYFKHSYYQLWQVIIPIDVVIYKTENGQQQLSTTDGVS